jgi:ABC-type multidrug transport system fused ATPase/permease subunit
LTEIPFSVTRYCEAGTLEQEAPHKIDDQKPPVDWPSKGALSFNNVRMAYRPGLPPVLHDISMHVKAGEKIGVVGRYVAAKRQEPFIQQCIRTGAGKSSLLIALYRIVELSSGSIVLDE